jgi:Tol biopolymer transport system component
MADIASRSVTAPGMPWRAIGTALIMLALIVGVAAVYIGSHQTRLPAPFGPAANGLIPYDIDGDVYAGDPMSGTSRLILGDDPIDIEPAYSRDGTRIAFERLVDPKNQDLFRFFVMNADGSDVHMVTREPLARPPWWDWTPTGDIIASTSNEVTHDIVVFDADGLEAPKVLTHGIDVGAPVYRPPSSQEILFDGKVGNKAGIFVMNADGTGLRALIEPVTSGNLERTLNEPRYAPDGSTIAFQQWDDARSRMRLYLMEADGANRREIAADPRMVFTGWPVWSNDGSRIAFVRNDSWEAAPVLAVLDVAEGTIVQTGPPLPDGGSRFEWAPDDSSILLSWDDGSKQMLLDPAGGRERALPWAGAAYPAWQRVAP